MIMKKTFLWIFIALISGAILGKLTFDKYENLDVKPVISLDKNVYMLKYGTYSNLDEMQDDVTTIDRYVYIEDNNEVKAYVAICTTKKNIDKIKDIYSNKNINLTTEKVNIDNSEFIQNLNEYEKLLDATDDEKSLLMIQNQILSSYEKMVVNNE